MPILKKLEIMKPVNCFFLPNAKGEDYTTGSIYAGAFIATCYKETFTSTLRQWMYTKGKENSELLYFLRSKQMVHSEYIQTKIMQNGLQRL
jgi:hypothetical protein